MVAARRRRARVGHVLATAARPPAGEDVGVARVDDEDAARPFLRLFLHQSTGADAVFERVEHAGYRRAGSMTPP